MYISNTARGLSELSQREPHATRKPRCHFRSISFAKKKIQRNVNVLHVDYL